VKFRDSIHQIIVQQTAEGDEIAFNKLFELYRNRLYSYMIKITKSKEVAEEATLDVFLKIWKMKSSLNEINNFEAFLFRLAHNKAIDYQNTAKKSQLYQQQIWSDMEDLVIETNHADENILKIETERNIKLSINKLSPQRQEAFRLSREEFLSYDEIADRMQISKHTVRNHIASSLEFIKSRLEDATVLTSLIVISSTLC